MPLNLDIKVSADSNGGGGSGSSTSFSSGPFAKGPPRILLATDAASFDPDTVANFRAEGYQVSLYPYDGDRSGFAEHVQHVGDPLGLSEKFAIVAYGRAAAVALEVCTKPVSKLCALVAYYPSAPATAARSFPPALKVCVHAAGDQKQEDDFDRSPGNKYRSYAYPDARVGFAERTTGRFDEVAANLAWTRTLGCVRDGFGIAVDLEGIWEGHLLEEFVHKDVEATMATMVKEPYVNHIPTMTGGIGHKDLSRFYRDFFTQSNPPSTKIRLISRTSGIDRIVDEMHFSFDHTTEVPWMLPGVAPTDKHVEVALVSVVAIRGGKLWHEHIYWDQASVLAQIGLLDPSKLPIRGAESAQKMVDPNSQPSNELIPEW